MKDGRTHLAYKAEHVVDLENNLVLATRITPADHGDADTLCDSLQTAQANLEAAGSDTLIEEAAADKGYHEASAGAARRLWVSNLHPRGRSTHATPLG